MGDVPSLQTHSPPTRNSTMWSLIKHQGAGNIQLEEIPIPHVGPRDVLVKTQVTLISSGSEVVGRYLREDALDSKAMGYSAAGIVDTAGEAAFTQFTPGDRVVVTGPHAQYVAQTLNHPPQWFSIYPLPEGISFEQASFLPLVTGAVWWTDITEIRPEDTVVVLGQGLVGNLVMQAARLYPIEQLIAVDALELRCALSQALGAHRVINAAEEDPVAAVYRITNGRGADVVIDCVGGPAGVRSFQQGLDMLAEGGTLHVIGLNQGQPLPLDPGKIQRKRIIGGYYSRDRSTDPALGMLARAIDRVGRGEIRVTPLITHRFPFRQAKAAFELLHLRPAEAMGVLLDWSSAEDRT